MEIHFFYWLHVLVCWRSLKDTFLLFLGHLAFVLLQRPLQVLVLRLGPADHKHQNITSLEGALWDMEREGRWGDTGNAVVATAASCQGPRSDLSPLLAPWIWRRSLILLLQAGSGTSVKKSRSLWDISVCDSLFFLGVQIPDQRVPFVDQYDQFIQQQLLSSLLGFSFLPVCKQEQKKRGTLRLWHQDIWKTLKIL